MKRICMLLNGPVEHDGRIRRLIDTLSQQATIDLFYVGGSERDREIISDNVRLYPIRHDTTLLVKILRHSLFYWEFNFFIKHVLAAKVGYDVIYANDLPTLYPAVWLKKKLKARLIYDAHEIYLETLNQFLPTRGSILKLMVARLMYLFMRSSGRAVEARLLNSVDAFITVNGSLAEYFKARYRVEPVEVIMNYPLAQSAPQARIDFRKIYNWQDTDCILLYQGSLNNGRGLELILEALPQVEDRVKLVIMGDGSLKDTLVELVEKLNMGERVQFIGFVPPTVLAGYTIGADIGINLLEDFNLSKKLASATKLFEYMQAGLPVLASATLENRRVFSEYEIGILTQNGVDQIARSIMQLVNSEELERFRKNALRGAASYTWQSQAELLRKLVLGANRDEMQSHDAA